MNAVTDKDLVSIAAGTLIVTTNYTFMQLNKINDFSFSTILGADLFKSNNKQHLQFATWCDSLLCILFS
jgi:hypothetical protein